MAKKKFALWKSITLISTGVVLSTAMGIGTGVALSYKGLLDVFFSKSDYTPSDGEKEKCEEVSREGIVLLKNEDNLLPLDNKKQNKVGFLGQDSVDFVYGGSGSGSVDTALAPTLKESFERAGFSVDETLWDFYSTGAGSSYRKSVISAQGTGSFNVNEVPQSVYTQDVKDSIKTDDVLFCCIGRSGGESFDLPLNIISNGYTLSGGNYLYLQVDDNERAMMKMACEASENVVLIVNTNNAVELGFLEEEEFKNIKSVLWVPGVGQEGLYALGDIVSGKVNPSGRLVDTWAYDSTSAPSFKNMGSFSLSGVNFPTANNENKYNKARQYIVYEEGIYVGYKYYETRYEDAILNRQNTGDFNYETQVQYPFGYGLSYSSFEWKDFSVTEKDDTFEINVTVENVGEKEGKDVVEIYMQSPYTQYDIDHGIEKAAVELVGFAKTKNLMPKDGFTKEYYSETVTISVDKENLAAYDADGAKTYIRDAGQYYFTAARDAHEAAENILKKKGADTKGDISMVDDSYHPETLDTTSFKKSKATGKDITNHFDDADPTYYGEEKPTYVSRNDWMGTLPTSSYKEGTWAVNQTLNDALNWNRSDDVIKDDVEMPINSSGTSLTIHDAVVDGVLKDYDDEIWDQLVNQISQKKMLELVRMGGYATISLKSIDLPATQDKDGPSGISGTLVGGISCMAWPVEVMMAATWNETLIEEMGIIIGDDSIQAGVAGWYAPGADIHRSPYSGRNFEYYSEDGFLSGKIGAAEVRGVRSRGVIAYMKHFALNDQETGRSGGVVMANEQSIREIFLKGFEMIVTEGGCTAAMAGMNRVGAAWAGAHKGLMTDVLREEWGFKGMVITDQASVSAMFYEDIISGLYAGTDMWLNTGSTYWNLEDFYTGATSNGRIMQSVHKAAKNIIYAVTFSNANADMNYQIGDELNGNIATTTILPWKTWLTIADVVVFAGSLALIGYSVFRMIQNKKLIAD